MGSVIQYSQPQSGTQTHSAISLIKPAYFFSSQQRRIDFDFDEENDSNLPTNG